MVAQHNALMRASGLASSRPDRRPPARKAEQAAIDLARHWLDRIGLLDRADDAAGNFPMATSAGWRSRAPCAPSPRCSASTSRRPGSTRAKAPLNELLLSIRGEPAPRSC